MNITDCLFEVLGFIIEKNEISWIDLLNHKFRNPMRPVQIEDILRCLISSGYVESNTEERSIANRFIRPTISGVRHYQDKIREEKIYWIKAVIGWVAAGFIGALFARLIG